MVNKWNGFLVSSVQRAVADRYKAFRQSIFAINQLIFALERPAIKIVSCDVKKPMNRDAGGRPPESVKKSTVSGARAVELDTSTCTTVRVLQFLRRRSCKRAPTWGAFTMRREPQCVLSVGSTTCKFSRERVWEVPQK